jgi:2-iminoacetate synthase ThiH
MGFEVAGRALRSGANDLCGTGSINAINACITAAGKDLGDPTEAMIRDVVKCIEAAGFTAALRDPYYNILARHQPAELEESPESAVAAGK